MLISIIDDQATLLTCLIKFLLFSIEKYINNKKLPQNHYDAARHG